jgi:hypothetical protein
MLLDSWDGGHRRHLSKGIQNAVRPGGADRRADRDSGIRFGDGRSLETYVVGRPIRFEMLTMAGTGGRDNTLGDEPGEADRREGGAEPQDDLLGHGAPDGIGGDRLGLETRMPVAPTVSSIGVCGSTRRR